MHRASSAGESQSRASYRSSGLFALFFVLLASCSGCTGVAGVGTNSSADWGERHVVQNRSPLVAFENFEQVSFLDVDLHTAVETREAIDVDLQRSFREAGHRRWFFHAFDRKHLDFVVAKFDKTAGPHGKYVAEKRLRVQRTPDAEQMLGVADCVSQAEKRRVACAVFLAPDP
jgi:hypothetical protein